MWRGLAFGVLLLAIIGLPSVLIPLLPREDISLGVPLLNKIMFAALPLIYGITLGEPKNPRPLPSSQTSISHDRYIKFPPARRIVGAAGGASVSMYRDSPEWEDHES